ncbi:restriction endonuclease subunit S [uncultured Microbacterium sp.]|uniref:restriction endonuclease subunit S n=1 Tax=uncultured Microbacterium sp. TaxID=191216 RepID=UPI00262AD35F|nr:restriction endonuclease subunit S [uncultured Microbacterium sp.]
MTWETVPLGKIALVNPRASASASASAGGTVTFLGMADLGEDGRTTDGTLLASSEVKSGYTPFENLDLLVAKITPCFENGKIGQVRIPTASGLGSTEFHVVRADVTRVDSRYLLHFLRGPRVRSLGEMRMTGSAGQKRVPVEFLRKLKVPLPPLAEQRRIAAILDEADALLTRAQAGFARFVEVRDAAFRQSTQTSATVALGAVSRMYGGSSLPEGEPFVGQADGYLCLKVSDMNRRDNEAGIANSSSWSASPGSRASTAPAGAVVIPKRGGAIGTNKKMQLLRPAILDPNLMAIEADGSTLLPATLLAWFKTIDLKTIQSGSSVPQLNKQDLIPLEVPIPPLDVQGDFSLSMSELRVSEASSRRRLVVLDSLFASLQHRAFRGEL